METQRLPHDHGQKIERKLENMPSPEDFQAIAVLLKQLSDGSRLRLFWLLCHGEECVINLSAMVGMSSPAVSHHLRQLASAKLIVSRREGKEVYYTAAQTEQAQLFHHMVERLIAIHCPAEGHRKAEQA